jgi:hypothetical protein
MVNLPDQARAMAERLLDATEESDLSHATHEVIAASAALLVSLAEAMEADQAKIDALMLEYCPDDMTPEQREEWARHQSRSAPPASTE